MLELLSRHQPGKCLPMVREEAKRRYPLRSGAGLGNGRNDCKRRKDIVGEKVPAVPGGVRMLEIILPIRVTAKDYGFNAVYAGKHWAKRNADAARIHEKVWAELLAQKIPRKPLKGPVILEFYYNSRLDCSNHGYITKLIEDGLKGWVIEDDDRKHVKGIYQGFWQGEGVKVRVREEEK